MPATIYHVKTQTVANGTATSVVQPSDWNSAHAVTLSPTGQEIIGAFSNGGNVTFGTNPSGYVTASAPTGGGAGDGGNVIAAGGSTANSTGTIQFSNANGVSFGLNGNTVTASHNGLTTAAQSNHSHNFATTTTNGALIVVGTTNSNGATIGVPSFLTTAQPVGAYLTTARASNDAVGLNTAGSNLTATINSSGISIDGRGYAGTGTSATNASITLNSNGLAISVAPGGGAGDGYNIIGVNGGGTNSATTIQFSNGNNVTFGLNAGTITASASYPAQTVQPVAYSAANGSANFSTLTFANSNGVSFSTGTQGLYASHNGLTTAAQSNHSHNFATTTTNGSQIVVGTTNSAGATIGVPPFITTYVAQTNQTVASGNIAGVGTTFAGANVSGSMTLNSNGLNLSLSAAAPGGGGAINVSAGTTSGNLQTIQFNDGNGVTFGLNGSTVTASVNAGGGGNELSRWRAFPQVPVVMSSSTLASGTSGAGSTTASFYVNPIYVDRDINAQEIEMLMSHGALSAGTGSCTVGYHLGFYTLDTAGGTTALRSVSTFSAAAYISQSSATAQSIHTYWGSTSNSNSSATQGNISAAFMTAGLRDIKLYDAAFTLPASTYYLVHGLTMRSSSVNIGASLVTGMYAGGITNRAYLGQSTIAAAMADRYVGQFSSQVTGAAGNTLSMSMPASINTSAITVSVSNAGRWLQPRMYN